MTRSEVATRTASPFSNRQGRPKAFCRAVVEPFDRAEMISWVYVPPARPGSSVGRDAGQPWKRPACPSSVASHTVRTLYLASRRSRASAAPQPPVNSQPTPTIN